jgi:hypothetical protein
MAVAPARHGGFPAAFVLALGVPWMLGSLGCALTCALTPRAVLRRVEPTPRALRRAALAAAPLAAAMCLITAALVVYALYLPLVAGGLASESSGPLGASVTAMLAAQCLLAGAGSAAAVLAALRGRRAALQAA